MNAKPSREPRLRPRMRVLCGEVIALGPGKVDLLALIGETGSIREAAERMGMSYMRAWKLIKTMNACFKKPLVEAGRGGWGPRGGEYPPAGAEGRARFPHTVSPIGVSIRRPL